MYQVDDYIVYGPNGVCKIMELCKSPFDPLDERVYYRMEPVFNAANSLIYTPIDNDKVRMRTLMTRSEAEDLLREIAGLELLEVGLEKKRRDIYKEAILTIDPYVYVRLIKTISRRKRYFFTHKKRLPEMDNEYDGLARRSLFAELSIILDVDPEALEEQMEELFTSGAAV